ncbi:MAG TPA: trigger factor [bacterium]|nr:trigger factor [bacterium]HOL47088.1 trigger factor [bacterium]HPQ18988.1 trigger factor [bacterium]
MEFKENLNKENWKCEVEITIEKDKLNNEFEKKIKEIKSQFSFPGFRKGKVSEKYLKTKFKDLINDEFKEDLKKDYLKKYLEVNKKIKPINLNEALKTAEVNISEDKESYIKYFLTIFPFIELKREDYINLEVKIKKLEIKTEEIENRINKLRNNYAEYKDTEKEINEDNNLIIYVDFNYYENDTEIEELRRKNIAFTLLSEEIKLYKEKFIGKKKGDEVEFIKKVTDEDSSRFIKYKDKELKVKVLITNIKEKHLPELNDAFAIKAGYDSLENLRNKIKEEYEIEIKNEKKLIKRRELIKILQDKFKIELPNEIIKYYIISKLQEGDKSIETFLYLAAKTQNIDMQKENALDIIINNHSEEFKEIIINEIFMNAIIEAENIEPTPEKIDEKLTIEAEKYKMDKKELKRQLINSQLYENFKNEIKKELAEEKILETIKFIEE